MDMMSGLILILRTAIDLADNTIIRCTRPRGINVKQNTEDPYIYEMHIFKKYFSGGHVWISTILELLYNLEITAKILDTKGTRR